MIKKNQAGQKIYVVARNLATNTLVTGDAGNITAQISKDEAAAAATNDVNPTELEATDQKGVYVFTLTQAETNADRIVISAVSSTQDVFLDPIEIYTDTPIYHADIDLSVDEANTRDEWTITWFMDGIRLTSGLTLIKLQAIKRVDGTNLINDRTMTQIASSGSYKYDATTTSGSGSSNERITAGESVLLVAKATIDGAARTFARVISRDSS